MLLSVLVNHVGLIEPNKNCVRVLVSRRLYVRQQFVTRFNSSNLKKEMVVVCYRLMFVTATPHHLTEIILV